MSLGTRCVESMNCRKAYYAELRAKAPLAELRCVKSVQCLRRSSYLGCVENMGCWKVYSLEPCTKAPLAKLCCGHFCAVFYTFDASQMRRKRELRGWLRQHDMLRLLWISFPGDRDAYTTLDSRR
jgi:hypothetical protein